MSEASSADDALFGACYREVGIHYFKGELPANFFSQPFMAKMWEKLIECPLWAQKGSRQTASRWFQWCVEMQNLAPNFGFLLVVALRIAVERGWYKTLGDTPLWSGDGKPPEDDDLESEAAPRSVDDNMLSRDAGPETPASAEEWMAKARKQVKNTMHLATNILCSPVSLRLMKMIVVLGAPSQERHNQQVVC